MAIDVNIYRFHERFAPSFTLSLILHVGLAAALIFIPAAFTHDGADWGAGGNGATQGSTITANLVGGLPLPPNPQAKQDSVLATESKGLTESQVAPKAKEDEQAIAIPDRTAKKIVKKNDKTPPAPVPNLANVKHPPTTLPTPSHAVPHQQPRHDNAVPFGEGAPAAGPYTMFQSGKTTGGMQFGEGGTGTFGSRFGWYTEVVARKVHQAWQSEVNPSVISAHRVYITFDIARNGTPSNVRVEQSSGVPSLDQSAVRALQRIDTFGPLPQGYNGRYVSVEFWFDYRR